MGTIAGTCPNARRRAPEDILLPGELKRYYSVAYVDSTEAYADKRGEIRKVEFVDFTKGFWF